MDLLFTVDHTGGNGGKSTLADAQTAYGLLLRATKLQSSLHYKAIAEQVSSMLFEDVCIPTDPINCSNLISSSTLCLSWIISSSLAYFGCFSCSSLVASTSIAASRLCPLHLLLPSCIHFSCCSPTASTCGHTHAVQSIIGIKVVHHLSCATTPPPPPKYHPSLTHRHTS